MFSHRTQQPIMEDIVSVFESTQNQPWSVFSDKLNSISNEKCKTKNVFKSENPIQLSLKNDYRVFGLIPRLEEFKLLSCKKCKMIVKEDCLLHHYNRRHNSGNDNFSLRHFLRPTINSNKHKRQKLNVRKLTKTKLMNGKIIDPVVQEIKTEFDEVEFERLSKLKLEKLEGFSKIKLEKLEEFSNIKLEKLEGLSNIKLEKLDGLSKIKLEKIEKLEKIKLEKIERLSKIKLEKIENKNVCNNNSHLNFVIETCRPVSSNFGLDWGSKNSVFYDDDKIEEHDVQSNKLSTKLPDEKVKLHCQKYGNFNNSDNTVNYIISSYDLLPKQLIFNDELKSNMLLNLTNEDKFKNKLHDKSKIPYCIFGGLSNKESIKFRKDYYSDIIRDNKVFNDVTHNQYSIDGKINRFKTAYCQLSSSLLKKNKIPFISKCNLDDNYDKSSCDYFTNSLPPLSNGDHFKNTSSTNYSDVTSNEDENNEIVDDSQNKCYKLLNNIEKTNYTSNKCSDVTSDKSSLNGVIRFYKPFTGLSRLKKKNTIMYKKYLDVGDKNGIEPPFNKKLTTFPSSNIYPKGTSVKYTENTVASSYSSSILPYSIKEVSKLPQSNGYSVAMFNKYSDNGVASYGQQLVTPLIDVIKSPNPSLLTECKRYKVDDIYSHHKYCHKFKSGNDKENYKINEQFLNNYALLMSIIQNDQEKTIPPIVTESSVFTNNENSDDIFSIFDDSTTAYLDNTEESKPKLGFDYSINTIKEDDDDDTSDTQSNTYDKNKCYYLSEFINSDISPLILSNYDYSDLNNDDSDDSVTSCDQSSVASLDIIDDSQTFLSTVTYSNAMFDESFDSDTSQSTSESLDVMKETKSTQTDLCLEDEDYEPSRNYMSEVGVSLIQLLNDVDNKTYCTSTDTFVDSEEVSDNCHVPVNSNSNDEIVENYINSSNDQISKDSIDGCIPLKSSAIVSESFVNGFTTVSSIAKIINNTIIPISTDKCRENYELFDNDAANDHYTSNSSQNTSDYQQIPSNSDNQNDKFPNHLTHSPIIDNNDKVYKSETCTGIQSDHNNTHHNANGPYHPIFQKYSKKTAVEKNFAYGKNYKIDTTVVKIKKNLKRNAVEVADDKENHKLWKYGTFKKRHKVEFVVRKVMCSDESKYNDKVNK